MQQYLKSQDLPIINQALNEGKDVKIQLTPTGYRIISETIRVIKKYNKSTANNPIIKR